ncbi:MAG: hypothetical protein VX938_02705, partial [Myxococcota bacterium]|nr:hypothetical protein [Myxococcota bacterium]
KMVNSLSLGKDIVNPEAINDEETIYRIFIDDYGWDYNPTQTVDIWESIVREYPYGVRYENEIADQNIASLSGTKMAYVNADWFVATASQPRLYHVILQLPNSEQGLEQMVGVDTQFNVDNNADGLRAGFKQSGVSNSNRIIERHSANQGMYWKSFDFATEAGPGNIMTYSLGPQRPEFTEEQNGQLFLHDGGEFIFALPNGLHAYMITTADGCRLDVAPTEIVDSPTQPGSSIIENGYSCMFCHREGIIPGIDDVRENWEQFGPSAPQYAPDGPLNGQEYVEEVFKIYVPEAEMTAAQDEDRDDYKVALEATGSVYGQYDPVSLLKFEFDEDMEGERVAAELGVTLEQLEQLVLSNPAINVLIGSALTATVSRQVFEAAFSEVVCSLFLGDPLQHAEACGDDCVPDCGDAICGDHDGCGGTCGECPGGHECVAGACYALCGVEVEDLCEGVECDDSIDCTTDACDPTTGQCVSTADDALCDDADACNGAETCDVDSGCLAGTAVETDDQISCTVDACDPTTGEVTHTADDTLCDDADVCTGVETCDVDNDCQAGTSVESDDQIDCTVDACDPATGEVTHTADDATCDDADLCTVDICGVAGCT